MPQFGRELWYKQGVSPKGGPYDMTTSIYQNSIGFASAPEYSPRMWKQSTENTGNEIFADMFLGWVFDEWAPVSGSFRSSFMNKNMPSWLLNHP